MTVKIRVFEYLFLYYAYSVDNKQLLTIDVYIIMKIYIYYYRSGLIIIKIYNLC